MRDHTLIEGLLAVEALGGLELEDRAALERERGAHGECRECGRLEFGFAETAGRLGFALVPIPSGPTTADEILRRAGARSAVPAVLVDLTRERKASRRAMLAAAVACVVVLGAMAIRSVTGAGELTAAFSGEARAHLEMTYRPGESGGQLEGSGLGDLPRGRVYELWAIRSGSAIRTTCFTPNQGEVRLKLSTPVRANDVMAVTVESAECPTSPTTAPILTADLSKVS